ncbi:MAG TPA: sigma-54 dependent transcriptional regulator [Spirochaetales bacterium]|nr:sigma-54 dependent transcriptional regulator [Spirochaetales bacterium]
MSTVSKARILIVDDETGILHGLRRFFESESFQVETAENISTAMTITNRSHIDVAIVDVRLKGRESGIEMLSWLRNEEPDMPVIMITGYGSIESAIDAMKRGAADYVLKPVDNETLLEIVKRNLELRRLRKDNYYLKKELLNTVYDHEIITQEPEMQRILARLDNVKNSSATILLCGESGTGKEVLARYIHFTGDRRDGPFVSINCAALSEDLLLSELFGHEKGAFTGAIERKLGKFELADKGTLFLDEIGDMSPSVQAKLLRVLEENAFERVGGTRRITVDIHVIAATNQDLRALMASKNFRNDLFYRISTVEIHLPPLRERRIDIPLLADYFMRGYASKYKKNLESISPSLVVQWLAYNWPGNIRELQNVVHQRVLMCAGTILGDEELESSRLECSKQRSSAILTESAAASPFISSTGPSTTSKATSENGVFKPEDYHSLKELAAAAAAYYERQFILKTLELTHGNKSKAARQMAVTRKTLLRKIKELNINV